MVLCLTFKAHQVLGQEALVKETKQDVVSVSADNELTVAEVKTQTYEVADHEAANLFANKKVAPAPSSALYFYPLIGSSMHTDGWRSVVSNSFVAGAGAEVPLTTWASVAVEGNYGDYDLRYAQFPTGVVSFHNFAIYSGGLTGKFYLLEGWLRPYLGGGMEALYFEGQQRSGFRSPFSRWIGAGVVQAGAEVEVARDMAIGARASYTSPFLNTPTALEPISQYPEGNVMRVAYFRFVAMLSVGL